MVGIYKKTTKDIMTKHVTTLRSKDTIHHALMMMAENDLSAIPVVDPAGKCVGIITQRDIIAVAREKDVEDSERSEYNAPNMFSFGAVALDELTNERVEDMMSERIVSVRPTDAVTDVAARMVKGGIHHIPVVGEDDQLLGIVSTMDVLASLQAG